MNSELRKLFSSFILHEPRYATAPRPRSPSRVSRRGFLSILMEVEKDGEKNAEKRKGCHMFHRMYSIEYRPGLRQAFPKYLRDLATLGERARCVTNLKLGLVSRG